MDITARYVDTCLSDYLLDGHTREGQTLCLASLGGERDLTVDALYDSIDWDSGLPDAVDLEDSIRAELRMAIVGIDLRYIDEDGNRCDETPDERDGDEPYIYVVLEWDATVVKMTLTLDVEYLANGVDPQDLKLMLESVARRAADTGQMTGNTQAEVKTWGATALEQPTDGPDIRALIEAVDRFHGNELKDRSEASISEEIAVIREML
jgi:hypothetical protein